MASSGLQKIVRMIATMSRLDRRVFGWKPGISFPGTDSVASSMISGGLIFSWSANARKTWGLFPSPSLGNRFVLSCVEP